MFENSKINYKGDHELIGGLLTVGFYSGFGFLMNFIVSLDVSIAQDIIFVNFSQLIDIKLWLSLIFIAIYSIFEKDFFESEINMEISAVVGLAGIFLERFYAIL